MPVSLLSALLAGNAGGAAPLDPDSRVTRRQTVAGVRVEAVAKSDGGRLVRMSLKGRGYRFDYFLEFWRGNGGAVLGASFRRGDCRSGDAGSIRAYEEAMRQDVFHARLSDYLRECPLASAREAELRRRLVAAWPAFSALAEQALAETSAENAAIADYGKVE